MKATGKPVNKIRRGLVVSDIHCGSIYGMLPPDFATFSGVIIPQNAAQKYLWQCWMDFCKRASLWQPEFVIVNGDVVDGDQHRNKGSELTLVSIDDQCRAAKRTLGLLKAQTPGAKWYFTQGTPYHVGEWNVCEEHVAEDLGAERYLSLGTGDYCREVLWLNVDGVIIEAAHHIAVSVGFYRLTALDREGQWSAISAKDETKGVPKSDLLIRSHVHYFGHAEHASKQIVTTPCWQLQTRYMRKNSVHRMHPDIGGLFIEVDPAAKERGTASCRIQKELYKLPPIAITRL